MKNKKYIVFILAVLILAMVFPSSAAAMNNKRSIKIRGSCTLPQIVIEVTVPTATRAYLNPSKVSIRTNHTISDGQIISEPAYIENKSVVPVQVNASVTGKVKTGSTMVFSPTSTKGSSLTSKSAFVYFELQSATDPTSEPWSNSYDAGEHILVGTTQKTKNNVVTLGAADEADRYGLFRLTGDCVESPEKPWSSRDGFYADIVFTFLPTER